MSGPVGIPQQLVPDKHDARVRAYHAHSTPVPGGQSVVQTPVVGEEPGLVNIAATQNGDVTLPPPYNTHILSTAVER